MAEAPPVKLAVQRRARALEGAANAHDDGAAEAFLSPEFAGRDSEVRPLLARAVRCDLIGTVANRTLLHVHLPGGETRVIELLWRDHEGRWLVDDARVFSLLPGE